MAVSAASPAHVVTPVAAVEPSTILPAGTRFQGVVAISAPTRIGGELMGRVVGTGPLSIEVGSVVEGDLEVDVAIVAGRVRGDIRATARIELLPTARVDGNLAAPVLRVAEGSRWNGRSHTR